MVQVTLNQVQVCLCHTRISPFVFLLSPPSSAPTLQPGSSHPTHHGLEEGALPTQDHLRQRSSAGPGHLLRQGHHSKEWRYLRSPVCHRQGHGLATATRTEP